MAQNQRRKQSEIIQVLFDNRKIDQVNQYLQQNPALDILTLKDSQLNTVLHQLSFEGHIDLVRLFVKEAKKRVHRNFKKQLFEKDQNQEILVWMNQQNNQGFTPLLYACFNGHLDLIKYFIEQWQVNYHLTNNTGLNPLHLAAQKNIVLTLLYFRNRIDINSTDKQKSTPLHWAAYMNSQQVVAYLLSEPALTTLNARDSEGNTPLMMAVSYGNTRVVRRLLIAGANRYLANHEGKIPMDIAQENQFNTIKGMLDQNYSCCDMIRFYCNVKLQYKPKTRNLTIPFIFLISLALNTAILNVTIKFTEWYPIYVQILILGSMLILYMTLMKGPDKLQTKGYDELLRDKNQKVLKKYCFECKNVTPKRGYHCDICRVCIPQYDHHCTWINNCVGKRNIGRFIFFLIFLNLTLLFFALFSVLGELALILDDPYEYKDWFQIYFKYQTLTERILLMCLLAVNFLSSLFVVPVCALFVVQVKNLLNNQTTYEMIRAPPSNSALIKIKMHGNKKKMSLRNCRVMCSDNPAYLTASLQTDLLQDQDSPDSSVRK